MNVDQPDRGSPLGPAQAPDHPNAMRPAPISPTEASQILDLARRWAPYGGPPEADIFIQFGVTKAEFIARVIQLTHRASSPPTPPRPTSDTSGRKHASPTE